MQLSLANQDILDFGNVFPSLPKGHAKLTYMAGRNWRKIKPTYTELADDVNPSDDFQEYTNALNVSIAGGDVEEIKKVQSEYAEVIEIRKLQNATAKKLVKEMRDFDGLHLIKEENIPLDELTPEQYAALIPFIDAEDNP